MMNESQNAHIFVTKQQQQQPCKIDIAQDESDDSVLGTYLAQNNNDRPHYNVSVICLFSGKNATLNMSREEEARLWQDCHSKRLRRS